MKRVLLIGASRGIGRELARQYRQAGWHVIATARSARAAAGLSAGAVCAVDVTLDGMNQMWS